MTVTTPVVYDRKQQVDSSVIDEVAYDETRRVLYVVFNDHDDHRAYLNVPAYVYTEFVNASSPGRFYNFSVKRLYDSEVFDYDDLEPRAQVQQPVTNVANSVFTGPWQVSPPGSVFNNYTVEYTVHGQSASYSTQATNDVEALRIFETAIKSLGLTYELVRVTRTF